MFGVAVGLGASADADPSVFNALSCSCPQRGPADSALVRDEIDRGIRQGISDVPASP
ncbi:hypothetical protein [Mycobacterium servetii]|uniref:Uncharacterized protein n=1 Tax=Mycobacterium servetii TaxID=3237418 RepID=A0ABV4BW06_9MYCO